MRHVSTLFETLPAGDFTSRQPFDMSAAYDAEALRKHLTGWSGQERGPSAPQEVARTAASSQGWPAGFGESAKT